MTLESTVLVFAAIAGIFYLVAAIQTSRTYLIPAGAVLILLGSMILTTGTIEINSGDKNIITENVTVKKTFENRTTSFRNIDQRYDKFQPSELLSLILIITGTGSMIIGANQKGGIMDMLRTS